MRRLVPLALAVLSASGLCSFAMEAQSLPTASRPVAPSVFLALSGNWTGLEGGRNLSLTAGGDISLKPLYGLLPAVELRGTYPLDSGQIVGEESVEAGLRLSKYYDRYRPYADFLFGRGQLNYQNGGLIVPAQSFRYLQSTSNVISPGIGVEVNGPGQLAAMLDLQLQHWDVPFDPGSLNNAAGNPTTSGSLFSKVFTVGVVYRFGGLEHGHPAP